MDTGAYRKSNSVDFTVVPKLRLIGDLTRLVSKDYTYSLSFIFFPIHSFMLHCENMQQVKCHIRRQSQSVNYSHALMQKEDASKIFKSHNPNSMQ